MAALPGTPRAMSQNRVIAHPFPWQIESTAHFDIYYYGAAGANLLPYTEQYLGRAYARAAALLRTPPPSVPFFLYNTHNDFEQSTITGIGEGTGGVTEAFKNRFLVGNTGSQRYLEYVIAHEYVHEVEYEYLFNNGFWRSVRLLKFIFYPNWLMEGLAEYAGGDLDATTREMYIRDSATAGTLLPVEQLHNFGHVLPHQVTLAYKESEMLMRFIAAEYGEDKLPKLLASYRDRFDANTVLVDVIGMDLYTLDRRFREYVEDRYSLFDSSGLAEPSAYGEALTVPGVYPCFNESAVYSPDGKTIAFIADTTGAREIYLADTSGGRARRLWGFGNRHRIESIHTEGRGLAFSPDGATLAFCAEREQKDYICLCDVASGRVRERDPGTDEAFSPAFSPDGKTIYFSGIREGFRDVYRIPAAGGIAEPLTAGPMDEIDTVAAPDGASIVFAAERVSPAGRTEYDLCRADLAAGTTVYLTSIPGDERCPWFSPDGQELYFTSDADGITDIYVMPAAGGPARRLTRVIGGNFQPCVSPDGAELLFTSFRAGQKHLYRSKLEQLRPLPGSGPASPVPAPGFAAPAIAAETEISTRPARPYRFQASTDLFFPILFYSSIDGFYTAMYYQASDMLGRHQVLATAASAAKAEYLDYSATYGYTRYRTQFYAGAGALEYFEDYDRTLKREENYQSVMSVYPLNRFQSVSLGIKTIGRSVRDSVSDVSYHERENIVGLEFAHDTVKGPYLEATSGTRLSLKSELAFASIGGDYQYQHYLAEAVQYCRLPGEQSIGLRCLAGSSYGRDAGDFRLGGLDRVRGIPSDNRYEGPRLFVTSVEWRFPIVHNINYHMWYIFPDFFFKSFYGAVFCDAGAAWQADNETGIFEGQRWKESAGVSLRFHTFILQAYSLLLNVQFARRFDDAENVLYFSAGSGF